MRALRTPRSSGPALLLLGLGAAAPPLLRRMRRELLAEGRLRPGTTAGMYAAYLAHATLFLRSLRGSGASSAAGPARALGLTAAVVGTTLCVAGMRRFQGPSQVSGTTPGALVESGVYRLNRNPQYTGYVLLLVGAAAAGRSARALGLALAAAGIFGWWVPVEERSLESTFGDSYRSYRARTRRWL